MSEDIYSELDAIFLANVAKVVEELAKHQHAKQVKDCAAFICANPIQEAYTEWSPSTTST